MPDATVLREEVLSERLPTAGLVILRDGDPGAPEVTLGELFTRGNRLPWRRHDQGVVPRFFRWS